MIASLNVIDGLFMDPAGVREFGLAHDFSKVPEFDGVKYPGFAPVKDDRFKGWLELVIGEAIGIPIKIRIAAFTAGTEDFETQQWIHADNNCSRFAGVIYLFDKPGYGTAFWKHNESGHVNMSQMFNKDMSPETVASTVDYIKDIGKGEGPWTRTDYSDSVFNRFIFYPTDRFHSRWPQKAFGTKPSNCRLTIALFFD